LNNTLKVTTPTDREIVLTRSFNAPRRLVFDTLIKPEMVKRWLLGPPGWSMIVCEIDAKVGNGYRYVWRNLDGSEMAMHGVFREIVSPECVVNTQIFDFGCEAQAAESLVTSVLTEQSGRTTLTITVLYPSKEMRDAVIASGMERGAAASYDRLAGLLATVSPAEPGGSAAS
jgi:uncharacterized protein YndB with AHSA1/START domain